MNFPLINDETSIQITQTKEGLAVLPTGFDTTDIYLLVTDPFGLTYGVEIIRGEPEATIVETGWRHESYGEAMQAIFNDLAAVQMLPRVEAKLFNMIAVNFDGNDQVERKTLKHCRTATARLAMAQDLLARVQQAVDEGDQIEVEAVMFEFPQL